MSENVSVIIPFYDMWELTHRCLGDLHKYIPEKLEIILVNDASKEDYDNQVGFWQQDKMKHHVRYVKNKENMGFGWSMNRGALYATGDVLVFLSNDVLFYNDFISEIVETPQCTKSLVGGELLDYDTGWNVMDGKVCPYINGWLMACTRTAWNEIGGFDLRYEKYDCEDIDLSLMFLEKGYNLIPLTKSRLRHIGGATVRNVNPDREAITRKNLEKLHQKWEGNLGFLDNYLRVGQFLVYMDNSTNDEKA